MKLERERGPGGLEIEKKRREKEEKEIVTLGADEPVGKQSGKN